MTNDVRRLKSSRFSMNISRGISYSTNFRPPALAIIIVLLCLICSCNLFDDDDDTFVIEGNVQFSPVEGGCWFILATDQTRYEPINLPSDLMQEGLLVRLLVRPRDDMVSVCMVGRIVEIVSILETGQGKSN